MTTRTPTRRHRMNRMEMLARNPISRAFVINRVQATHADRIIIARTQLYQADHGQDATELLASVAVCIGGACQLAASLELYQTDARVRMLHGALRTVQAMCLAGYKWQSEYAHALNAAIVTAQALLADLKATPEQILQAARDAEGFADEIMQHAVRVDSVFGGNV